MLEGGTDIKAKITCAFGSDQHAMLDELRKGKQIKAGDKVVIRGTCNGMKGFNATRTLQVDNCMLADPAGK